MSKTTHDIDYPGKATRNVDYRHYIGVTTVTEWRKERLEAIAIDSILKRLIKKE